MSNTDIRLYEVGLIKRIAELQDGLESIEEITWALNPTGSITGESVTRVDQDLILSYLIQSSKLLALLEYHKQAFPNSTCPIEGFDELYKNNVERAKQYLLETLSLPRKMLGLE